ncbi:DNA polymerase I [Peribacillus frigoritolerans]|uniref:DNA polymerase I n=1 Tax=Peribacillus frigoritolerans TaxID=450367 RepID=UPI000BBA3396|nr:DNA polymerase I [Peribacillus frigoritolerans]PCD09593.1 DNA polymerase I [Peribacillus simplex]PEO50666.1 DNA polymerase I [Bacillus sp. AFS026049]QYF84637.1 DNA polymerase I [Brevibacterium sp. PAMC21349]MCM3166561.1 DNA polymerase I [Peribacillus frigoritolerans]MDF1996009.1 DNA polymerase I [Peribacillus frigoritolerans]
MDKKLVLIDGNSIAYRAFFALPLLNNDKGVHTNSVYGFTMMLNRILEEEKPTHILVAFDAGKTTFRHASFKEYKGGRQKTPPELSEQFPFIRELLDCFQIKRYELENYEADDIIGTLSLQAEKDGFEVKVISGDKDLTQLSSPSTTVSITKKGITEIEEYTPKHIHEKYGLSPLQIIDLKGLMGDASDNIPGIPGVGEKTALKLLHQFETVENLLQSIDEVSGQKLKEKIEEHKDLALLSKELATITREAPLEVSVNETEYTGMDQDRVISFYKELGFSTLLDKLDVTESAPLEQEKIEVHTAEMTEGMFADESALYVEILEDNYHRADIIGIAISNEQGHFYFNGEDALSSDAFKSWAEDETKKKTVFDAKRTVVALRHRGVEIKGIDFDVFLASYILDPAESVDEVAEITKTQGTIRLETDDVFYGKGAKRKIPEEAELREHIARKSKAIFSLKEPMIDKLQEFEQYHLFTELELPLSIILANMEWQGIKVDIGRLKNMGQELAIRLRNIEARIFELAGEAFNINSPKQLGAILFEKLELPVMKKTKTGYSTSADVLEKLESKHDIVKEILLYRQLGKLQSTYIEGLLKVVNGKTDKVHTRFNQALTQTGRLSSTDPNLQNIPIRLEEGRKIRQAFIPSEKDWIIFAADYSQIELRVLAHIANDSGLVEAFQAGMDIHTRTAMDVFHVSADQVTSNMRRHAKAVNFGIVYGISDYGLSQSLGITRKEAGEFIEKYLRSFPGVQEYMEESIHEARQKGYSTTLMQRRRYIPEITSRNFNIRSFAERTAMNTPIQGSAADIIKLAMINMNKRLKREGLKTRMLLQVHDELIFETPPEELEILKVIVPEEMENAIELNVPLKVDYAFGPTWFDAK